MPSIEKACNEPITCRYFVESKCLNVKNNVKLNSVFIIRVQGMTIVNSSRAKLAFERKKCYDL